MESAPDQRRLGEYLLTECLIEGPLTRTWLAAQESVQRAVLIEELRPECAEQADAFLADIRAKAAVDHPTIGSVYEAVAVPGLCFYARELLPGASLEDRLKASEPLKPVRMAHYLRRIAEANLYHEARGHATAGFSPAAIHLDDQGVIRFENLALAAARAPEQSQRDILGLGHALPALVADGLPGATRMFTLLAWMRGEHNCPAIDWKSIHGYCQQIEQQLAEPLLNRSPVTAAMIPRRKLPLGLIGAALVVVLAGGLAIAIVTRHRPPPPRIQAPEAVTVSEGVYPTPDGSAETHRAFRIAAHEVTISQYAAFLEALEVLAKEGRGSLFDFDNQPAEKTSHLADDWAALVEAARAKGTWHGYPVTLDSPVVGVDWWDAAAYAEWKQARLPTQEEWFAALRKSVRNPADLPAGAWQPVTQATADRTPSGLLGMAGSVAEWTRRQALNPANPQGQRLWVIIGGSYLNPANGALTREWTDNRQQRRPDLGFRVVTDPQ
ncbi:MAG: SUMF1/EgtB/PvdO family nonheme iron enzyme [Verrucomicrobia bacterium]|nr:MAG: SUMF1/EgtB/PvdO family nonheme iron enzyme [Verrucomicrobiota bacterium]